MKSSKSRISNREEKSKKGGRYYRPELDALRFFSFIAVLLHHGPTGKYLDIVVAVGAFGLSMFFLLSAFLITELLLREREQTATVTWKFFFIRRALRIWPLYFSAVALAIVIGLIDPRLRVAPGAIAPMSLFVANWFFGSSQLGGIVGPLWSISVEEQFYVVWPPVMKVGGKKLAFWASIIFILSGCVWIWFFSGKGWKLWYDTPVEFLFFAAGALIALACHGRSSLSLSRATRSVLLIAGSLVLVIAAHFGGIGSDFVLGITRSRLYLGYAGAVVGCGIIFLAILGMSEIPRPLAYLGKISYGLYVFHLPMLLVSEKLIAPLRTVFNTSTIEMFLVDGLALVFSIVAAHFSYQYFERPFMQLKERFAVIESRPV